MEIISEMILEDKQLPINAGWLNQRLRSLPEAESLVEINTVFNPGGILTPDGRTVLILRFETRRGNSGLVCIENEEDGDWKIIPKSLHYALPLVDEGLEDPRVVWFSELNRYFITYTAVQQKTKIAFIATDEFNKFERKGEARFLDESDIKIDSKDNKDACLLQVPVLVNGEKRFGLIHRPHIDDRRDIWFSYSREEITKQNFGAWEGHSCIARTRGGTFWDNSRIGLGPQLVELPREIVEGLPHGLLLLYHGVKTSAGGPIYRMGLMWFSLEDLIVTHRSPYWILGSSGSFSGGVVFPEAAFFDHSKREIVVYYGKDDDGIRRCVLSPEKIIAHLKCYPV